MPDDRSPSDRGSSRGGNGGSRKPSGKPDSRGGSRKPSGKPDGRGGSRKPSGKPDGRGGSRKPSGKPDGRGGLRKPSGKPDGRGGSRKPSGKPDGRGGSRKPSGASDGRGRRDDRRPDGDRPPPRTEAERRAAEVRARRGPRRTPRTEEGEQAKIEARTTDQWIDEGSVRDVAEAATQRAGGRGGVRRDPELDPAVAAEIHGVLPPDRAKRLTERLASASAALDRERFEEARRMVAPLTKELPQVAAVHEVNGLASYRLGRWKDAARSLELARQLHPDPSLLPVLADCYRASGRWNDVDDVWSDIKAASPAHEVMAEGRIVAASSLADRGDLKGAIAMMSSVAQAPKRVRDHHLRQWYVLADFYDRAGDTLAASRWFNVVAADDPDFADVRARLRALGR